MSTVSRKISLYDSLLIEYDNSQTTLVDFNYKADQWKTHFRSRIPNRRQAISRNETNQGLLPLPKKLPKEIPHQTSNETEIEKIETNIPEKKHYSFPNFTLLNQRNFETLHSVHTPLQQKQQQKHQHVQIMRQQTQPIQRMNSIVQINPMVNVQMTKTLQNQLIHYQLSRSNSGIIQPNPMPTEEQKPADEDSDKNITFEAEAFYLKANTKKEPEPQPQPQQDPRLMQPQMRPSVSIPQFQASALQFNLPQKIINQFYAQPTYRTPPPPPPTPESPYINSALLHNDYGTIDQKLLNIPLSLDRSDKSITFTEQREQTINGFEFQSSKSLAPLEWNLISFHSEKYYTRLKVAKENRMHQAVQHSDPALNLVLIEPNLRDLENFHHPHVNTLPILGITYTVTWKPDEIPDDDPDAQISPFLKDLDDLSGRRGGIIVVEHTVEYPQFITNVGMASTLVTFWHKAHANDNPRTFDQHIQILDPDHASPFIGEIPKNEPVQCLSCNMFNVPVAKHPVESTDFLLVRSLDEPVFYLRNIDACYCAGLLEARTKVMRPGTKDAQKFNLNFIKAILINIFRGTKQYPGRHHIQVQNVIKEFFPDVNEPKLRNILKDFADFYREQGNGFWRIKEKINLDAEFQKIDITPEDVCSYQSMLVGHYHLKKSGVNILIRSKRVYQQIQKLEGELTKKVAARIEIELMKTPWARTENFVKAFEGQAMQIQRTEDGQQIMRSKSRREHDNSAGAPQPAPKKPLAGTKADLRALTLRELRDKLVSLGVPTGEIERLSRWNQVALLRELANSKAQDGKEDNITENFSRGPRNDNAAIVQRYKKVYQETFLNNLNFIASNNTNSATVSFDDGRVLDDIAMQMNRQDEDEEEEEDINDNNLTPENRQDQPQTTIISGGDPPELVPYGLATHPLMINWPELGFGDCPKRKAAKIINVSLDQNLRPVVSIQWRRTPHQIADLEKLESPVNNEQTSKTITRAEDIEAVMLKDQRKKLLDKKRRTMTAQRIKKNDNTPVQRYIPYDHQVLLVTDPDGQLSFQLEPEIIKKIVDASTRYNEFAAANAKSSSSSSSSKKKSGRSQAVVLGDSDEDDDDIAEPTVTVVRSRRSKSPVTRFNELLREVVNKLKGDGRWEIFYYPVSKKEVPDYHKIIKTPMCLQDIERNVKNEVYTTVDKFYQEMSQIRINCKTYNEDRNPDLYRYGELFWETFLEYLRENREEIDTVANEIDPVIRK